MKYDHFSMLPERAFRRVAGRMTLEGSSGGGSSSTYYGNMDNLYGVQSQAAQYMLNNSMPYIPQYMQNSSNMVNDAMDGTLASKMRQEAGDNATATMGAALDSSNRNMQRYGMQFSPDALLAQSNKNAITGAAQKAGAMNTASVNAEDMKWNMNAGALAQATGMGSGSMSSLGGAAAGYGSAGNTMAQYEALNSAGYGKFGSSLASSMYKNGGRVHKPGLTTVRGRLPRNTRNAQKIGLHLAAGGTANPWSAWQNNNPIQTSQPSGGNGVGSGLGLMVMGASPIIIGKGLKAAWSAGKDVIKNATPEKGAPVDPKLDNGGNMSTDAPPVDTAPADSVPADTAPADAAATNSADMTVATTGEPEAVVASQAPADAGAAAGASGLAEGAGTAAAAGAAEGAGTAAATEGTAAAILDTAAEIAPLALAANGGAISRKNLIPGGRVSGPGTTTSDSIPAWLSDGEHVQNSESAKLVGLSTLNKVNDAGLKVRQGKQSTNAAKSEIGKAMVLRGQQLLDDKSLGLSLARGGRAVKLADGGDVDYVRTSLPKENAIELAQESQMSPAERDVYTAVVIPNRTSADLNARTYGLGLNMANGANSQAQREADAEKQRESNRANINRYAAGGNVGIALGAAADEYDRQKQLGMEQQLTDLRVKQAQPYLNTQQDQEAYLRSGYGAGTAQNNLNQQQYTAQIGLVPLQTDVARKTLANQNYGVDQATLGNTGKALSVGDVPGAVTLNRNAGLGLSTIVAQPNNAGVDYVLDDGTTQPHSAVAVTSAMSNLGKPKYESVSPGATLVKIGDNGAAPVYTAPVDVKQHTPVQTQLADDWVAAGFAKDRKDAFAKMNTVRGKSEDEFVLDYVSKNAGMGKNPNDLADESRSIYRSVTGNGTRSAPPMVNQAPNGTNQSPNGANYWQQWMQ